MISNYAVYEYFLAASLLVISMLGMGTALTAGQFVLVARAPQGVLLIIAVQVLLTPFLALLLARLLLASPGVAVGMLLIAALPGGSYSNLLTYWGRGNVALSVSATAVCTLGCLLTTPFVLKTFGGAQLPGDFSMPVGRILAEIAGLVVVPLVSGMTMRRYLPVHSTSIGKVCMRISLVILSLLVVASVASGRLQLSAYSWLALLALLLFGLISLWLCYGLCALMRFSLGDSFTIAVEVVVRNGSLGLLLKASLFPAAEGADLQVADGVLYAVLVYSFISLAIAAFEVVAKRRGLGLMYGRRRAGDLESFS